MQEPFNRLYNIVPEITICFPVASADFRRLVGLSVQAARLDFLR